MKHLILLIVGLVFYLASDAQISITSSDIINAGDSIFFSIDNTPGNSAILPGSTGNQSWDFTSLEEHDIDSIFLLHADQTPYYSSFSTSNLAAYVLPESLYAYVTLNENGLYQDGIVADINDDGTPEIVVASRPDLMIALPANYQDMVLDTAETEIILDNMKLKQNVFSKDTIDAYGDLSIPAGTFSTLRKFRTNINVDSIFTFVIDTWVLVSDSRDTTYEYEWWTNDPSAKFFICSFQYDFETETISSDIDYLKEIRFSTISLPNELQTTLIYPNPGKGLYTLKSDLPDIHSVELIDYTGKVIDAYSIKNNVLRIDISDKPAGIYFFKVNAKEKTEILKVILVH